MLFAKIIPIISQWVMLSKKDLKHIKNRKPQKESRKMIIIIYKFEFFVDFNFLTI